MKTVLLTLLAFVAAVNAFAQGTVNFVNLGPGLNAPVFVSDGTTKIPAGNLYTAELLACSSPANLASVATANFVAAGYFQGSPAAVSIPTVAGGATAFLEVRVFSTASGSFAAAQASNLAYTWGQSAVFSVVTGNPGASPPGTPAQLTGLTSFTMNVPEPSALALLALGSASLLFRRRLSE